MNAPESSFHLRDQRLEDDAIDRFAWTGAVSWNQSASVRIHCCWPRQAVRGLLAGDFGAAAGIRRAQLRVSIQGPVEAELRRHTGRFPFRLLAPEPNRLKAHAAAAWEDAWPAPDLLPYLLGLAELGELAGDVLGGRMPLESVPRSIRQRLLELFPDWDSGVLPGALQASLEPVAALSDRIWAEALRALERQCVAALAAKWRSSEAVALFEEAFETAAEASAQWERLRQGELNAAPHWAGVSGEWVLELHLPLMDRNEWKTLLDYLPKMEVQADDLGRVLLTPVEPPETAAERSNARHAAVLLGSGLPQHAPAEANRPTVAFFEQRRLSAAQARHVLPQVLERYNLAALPEVSSDVDLSLTVGLTADAQPWLEAPRPRSPEYYAAFGEMARAIQLALRAWAPYFYFLDLERFEEPETAVPMLVYQASRPASAKAASDFTYDVMNLESVSRALRTASAALPDVVRSAAALLEESGRPATAARYRRLEPRSVIQAVKQRPRWFQSLLAADAAIVAELIKLAMVTRTLRDEPAEAPRRLHRALEQFTGAIHQRLRRLYGRFSAVPLGTLVLLEASHSLATALGRPATLQAILRWRPSGGNTDSVSVSEVRAGGRPV